MKPGAKTALIALSVALFAFLFYARTAGFDFVNYDDNNYFYENPHVTQGLTAENIRWAFEIHGPSMWVPLTWLSHQTAVTLFGTAPGPHHLINTLLHALNAALLFLLLRRLTARTAAGLIAALLFAIHPMHVESVAWVTERKDVLAGCFWLLTLLAYDRYAQRPNWKTYLPVALGTALAVMAKPLAVTLPCVLLLLDFWPGRRPWSWRLVTEKLPLFLIVGFASFMTVRCQLSIGAIGDSAVFPMVGRIANACISYSTYLLRLLGPHHLAVFYPYPETIHWVRAGLGLILLLAITAWVLIRREKSPWAIVGWLWYLGALFPMIGIVQAGSQAMADRYMYVPAIGIYLIAGMVLSTTPLRRKGAFIFIGLLCLLNVRQVAVWKNSRTLFAHALKATEGNYLAHNNYGLTFREEKNFAVAREHFEASLNIRPSYYEARNNLGITLADLGEYHAAIPHLQFAATNQGSIDALYNLGTAYLNAGHAVASEACLRSAAERDPQNAGIHYNLGYALQEQKRWAEASAAYETTLRLRPDHHDAQQNLNYISTQQSDAWRQYEAGNAFRESGQSQPAERAYRRAIELNPGLAEAYNNLGVLLGQQGNHTEALRCFEAALTIAPEYREARTNSARASAALTPAP
ncbi:tetratricopeptide repeat protein [Pontiellaceae bacterium B12227]|nr:tetratricopeptide repeat protein [Pontiellaceae bacterium B12227]